VSSKSPRRARSASRTSAGAPSLFHRRSIALAHGSGGPPSSSRRRRRSCQVGVSSTRMASCSGSSSLPVIAWTQRRRRSLLPSTGLGESHTRTVLSSRLAVSRVRPSRPKATARTRPRWVRGGAERLGSDQVPSLGRTVVAAQQEGAAVAAEGHGGDGAGVRERPPDGLPRGYVPQARRLNRGARGGPSSAGRWSDPTAGPSSPWPPSEGRSRPG